MIKDFEMGRLSLNYLGGPAVLTGVLRRERGDRGVREGGVRIGAEFRVMLDHRPRNLGNL